MLNLSSYSRSDADRVSRACTRLRSVAPKNATASQVERVKVNDRSTQRKIPPSPRSLAGQLSRARSKNPRRRKFVYERATGGIGFADRPNIFEVAP